MLHKLLLIFAVASYFYQLTDSFTLEQFKRIRRVMNAAKTLKHGEGCSWEVEELRQNWTRLFASGNNSAVARITREFEERGHKLCDDRELFVCDRESEKCVCGDQGFETLIGVNRTIFTLEGSETDTRTCRWNTDSYCFPEEFRRWPNPNGSLNSLCKSGTTCTTYEGSLCTRDFVVEHIMNATEVDNVEYREVMKGWMDNRICSCVVDH